MSKCVLIITCVKLPVLRPDKQNETLCAFSIMSDKFGVGTGHEESKTMNGDLDDGPQLFICHGDGDGPINERKKTVHNSSEKKRKEKIRHWIQKIGEELPPLTITNPEKERQSRSTLEIVENAWEYIRQLKEQNSQVEEEVQKLRIEHENVKAERDRLQEMLKMTEGIHEQQQMTPASEPQMETAEKSKQKTKRRNTINLQLEQMKKQQQQQQQVQESQQTAAAGMQDMLGTMGNPMANFPSMMIGGAGQQMINQQMLMNSMMFGVPPGGNGGNQIPMGANQGMQGVPMQCSIPGSVQQSDKNLVEAGAGLLQLAMQDAGITTSSTNQSMQVDENTANSTVPRISDQSAVSSALHTLASVASNTQNVTNISQTPANQVQSVTSVVQTGATTATTQSINTMAPIMATGQQNLNGANGNMMNMSFMNGQQQMTTNVMAGNQAFNAGTNAMQQIMFLNEQGVPCIANVPVGIDPASLGLPNVGKQILGVDKSGNLLIQNLPGQKDNGQVGINDQQTMLANTLAQQQMNLAIQGIPQQPFQQGQNNVAMGTAGGIVQQPMNNQLALNQQMMQPMQNQIQGMNNPAINQPNPQGLILPVSQTGNLLTVNSVNNFQNHPQSQLPQALLLPNGQIIPVVSNPNLFAGPPGQTNQLITPGTQPTAIQGGAMPQRLPMPQTMVSADGSQVIVTSTAQIQVAQQPNSTVPGQVSGSTAVIQPQQGLLMTTNSVIPQVSPSTSTTASSTASLVPTTVITSTVTSPSGVSNNRKPKTVTSANNSVTTVSATTGLPDSADLFVNQGNLIASGVENITTASNTALTQVVTSLSDPNSASMKILNPQLQSALHGQLGGSTAPILLTMKCNGQPTSILVDPTTMQVLGTVQTQQPPQQTVTNIATTVANSTPSKKSKKNSQRAICPKPGKGVNSSAISTSVTNVVASGMGSAVSGAVMNQSGTGVWINSKEDSMEMLSQSTAPVKKTSKPKSKSKSSKGSEVVQDSTRTETSETGEQDILAKAAESIFSEISPVNFYNPANEDNPLQIDTSVCEGEEEQKEGDSPLKDQSSKGKVTESTTVDHSIVLDSEQNKSETRVTMSDSLDKDKKESVLPNESEQRKEQNINQEHMDDDGDLLTNFLQAAELTKSSSQEKFEQEKMNENESVGKSLFDIVSSSNINEPSKKSKKTKKSNKANAGDQSETSVQDSSPSAQMDEKSTVLSTKRSSKKSRKVLEQEEAQKEVVTEPEPLISLPDEITFSENDLSDVLDQVEQLGNSFEKSPQTSSNSSKKSSKSKKGRNETPDAEPANKRRKRNTSKEKVKDVSDSQQKSSMSVYDFDEDTDFSTPLFPLHSSRNSSGLSNKTPSSSEKTPTSSSSPLFSMPVITEQNSSAPLFEEFNTAPKKRGKHKKNKKVEVEKEQDAEISFKTPQNDLFSSNDDSNKNLLSHEKEVPAQSEIPSQPPPDNVQSKNNLTSLDSMEIDFLQKNPKNLLHKNKENELLSSKEDSTQLNKIQTNEDMTNKTPEQVPHESQRSKDQLSLTNHNVESPRQERNSSNLNSFKRSDASRTNIDQISLDSNPLTVDTNDIENTMNNLLGLSPHLLSPSTTINTKLKQVQQSPQLQTPKSVSPASLKSPVSMTSPVAMVTSAYQPQSHPASDAIMSRSQTINPSISNFSSSTNIENPYSAESLFSSQSKQFNSTRTLDPQPVSACSISGIDSNIMKSQDEKSGAVRPKSIYSAENFVQSSKGDLSRTSKSGTSNISSPSLPTSFPRSQNENSSDGFNFSNIGLNLSLPTTSTNSFMESLAMSPIISTIANSNSSTTASFTFTLSSGTTTVTTSSATMMSSTQTSSQTTSHQGSHTFPFYSPHQSPQRPSSQQQRQATTSASPQHTNTAPNTSNSNQSRPSMNAVSNFDLNLPATSSQMPSSQSSQHRSNRDRSDRIQQQMSNLGDSQFSYGISNSVSRNCSVQEQRPREQNPMPREQAPCFPNITVTSHEGPLNMGMSKSNHHKRLNEMNQRNLSAKSNSSESRSDRSSSSGYSMQPFFPPPNFSSSTSNPLETPPLHHHPIMGSDNRSGMGARGFDSTFPPHSQSYNPVGQSFSGNRYDNMSSFSQRDSSGTQPLSHTPPSQVVDGRKSANPPTSQNAKTNKQPSQQMQTNQQNRTMNGPPQSHRSGPTPPQAQPPGSHRPTPPHQIPPQPPSQHSRSKSSNSRSSSSKQSQKKKQNYMEMESGLPPHPAMFDANRMTPFLPIPPQARSPPFSSNIFGSGPHQGSSMSKNSDLGSPFNQMFPPSRPQNGLGFNFQPGFGMNSVHGGMSNSPQITPHSGSVTVTPHMSNFTFTNIFSDVNNSSQNDSLNISPIKFPHSNPMLPPQGMDPNSLHHPHQQGSSIYHHHNRPHPPSVIHNMNINSILSGHNHHGFDSRTMSQGMNTSVAPPFPVHGHTPAFGIPPLNFSMHDP